MRGEKTALKIAAKYQANVEKGVENSVKELDKLLDQLSKYQNKSGTVSKSKTRSKKAQKAVRDLLKDINKYNTAKARQKNNKAIAEASETLQKALGLSGAAGKAAAETFMKYTKGVIRVIRESEVILALAQADFDADSIMNIMEYIQSQLESSVPDEMRKFVSEDDVSLFISNLENLNYLYPDLSTEEKINIADMMQQYGFDNVDDAVERYFSDEDSLGAPYDYEDDDYDY